MATYFIHPGRGSDDADGLTQGAAWKGFGPLGQTALGPGDRVEVIAPGPLDRTLHIRGQGAPDVPITIHLAPGRYDCHPARMERRLYNISNCNDGRLLEKAVAVLVEHASHVRIEGPGAKLICRGKMIELCVDHSHDVEVTGLTFDYHRPTVSEFTVESITADAADLRVHPDSTYELIDGQIRWIGEGWDYTTGLAQELILETDEVWRRADPLLGLRIEELSPNHLRAHGKHDMTAGRVFQLRNTFRDYCGVFFNRSEGITLRQVQLAYMHGMGVLGQFTKDITLEGVTVAPDESSGRTTAAWADCLHLSGCRGQVNVRDCVFNGAHDDAINIHGTYLRIIEQIGQRQVRVAFMHRQTFGFQAFDPGDSIEFVHADSLESFANGCVTAVEALSPYEQLLTLAEDVPTDWQPDDVIENVTWTPQVHISGCTARRIPSRGFLLTTRGTTIVEDCTFVRLRHGIQLELDARKWFESGPVQDMTMRDNRFVNGKGAAIRMTPDAAKPGPPINRNITITGNQFRLTDGHAAVEATRICGLKITNNTLLGDAADDVNQQFKTDGCEEVVVDGNRPMLEGRQA
jgi:hypothetical protein